MAKEFFWLVVIVSVAIWAFAAGLAAIKFILGWTIDPVLAGIVVFGGGASIVVLPLVIVIAGVRGELKDMIDPSKW